MGTDEGLGAKAAAIPAPSDKSPGQIARLVATLASADNRAAELATDSLAAIDPAATDALNPAIEGNDHQARYFAVKATVNYGPAGHEAVAALTSAVERRTAMI